MGYIYCITNLINSKRYIGKTTTTIKERWYEHCWTSLNKKDIKYPLYAAMRKYGVENFLIECLEEVNDELLSEKEVYWIKELETYGTHGYNATKGGDGVQLYDHEELLQLARLGYTVSQICEKVGCGKDLLYRVLRAHGVKTRRENTKLVALYDLAGNYIQTFLNGKDALDHMREIGKCKSNKTSSSRILDCCKHKILEAYGYKWEFLPDPL